MVKADKQKKTPIVPLLLAFVVVLFVMFVANYRSKLTQELAGPTGGVKRLSAFGNQLIAISQDNDVYVWNWNDLSDRPQAGSVDAEAAIAMSADRLVWVPSISNDALVVSNLKGDKELKRLPLGFAKKCKFLKASANGKYAVVALEAVDYANNRLQLAKIDSDFNTILPIETKLLEKGLKLNDICISNDGTLVAAAGGKEGGWLLVCGGKNNPTLWEHHFADTNELNNVVFSPDGKTIYAADAGRFVYAFDVAAKKAVGKFEIPGYETPANNPQTISCIAVSCDGRLLAAASAPHSQVWVWDVKSGVKVFVAGTSQFSTSGVAFSPDVSLLAAADLTTGPIKIWRLPGNP